MKSESENPFFYCLKKFNFIFYNINFDIYLIELGKNTKIITYSFDFIMKIRKK